MKIWIIIAVCLVVTGLVVFAAVMTSYGWDFSKLNTAKYETNTYDISDEFQSISIQSNTADVIFEVTDKSECRIVCYEAEKAKHSVSVKNGVLMINITDERKWYDFINISFDSPQITVYIPADKYGELSVRTSTGDVRLPNELTFSSIDIFGRTGTVTNHASASEAIRIRTNTGSIHMENISAGMMDLSVTTGSVTLSDILCYEDIRINVSTGKATLSDTTCKNLMSEGDTGNMVLRNVIAEKKFIIERDTGDVFFDRCDAAELFIETDTGDVEGSLLSDKIFIVDTDTGNIDVPKTVVGGRCEIDTDTGDVKISIIK